MKIRIPILALAVLLSTCTKEKPATDGQQFAMQEKSKTSVALIAEAKEKLTEAKNKLIQEGKYACCVKDPCNYCALHESSCPCFHELKAGRRVCIECYAGWQQGRGAVENIKKQNVTTDFIKHEHKH